jgi:AhpD family alkylhydroperoxidase
MQTRFLMGKVQPDAYRAMGALDKYVNASSINPLHREMIKIRASQMNGCAYCVNHHTRDARKLGETEQRIYLMSVWREAGSLFSDEEQILLEMTEEITLIHQHGLHDTLYEKAIQILGELKTAEVIMIINVINAWNRIGVSLNMHPEIN